MRIVFFGCTKFSERLLDYLLNNGNTIVGIFSIPEEFEISYSKKKVKNTNFADFELISNKNNIPYYEIDSVSGKKTSDFYDDINNLKPDVILVLGWYYMVPKAIRQIPKYGAWGIHASVLPNYAGGAPLVWAMIEGAEETGVTLFRMDGGVDDGDIIAQERFSILENDTIKEVYEKATLASIKILDSVLKSTDIKFLPQDKSKIKVYPQRNPEDGLINWSWDSRRLKNFIRAQTKPYPGAYTIINGKKIIIWDAKIEDL
tara:strand:- start:278 stop:1054 length:777 start_codon:yes stop_codon:yes gene_type:complete